MINERIAYATCKKIIETYPARTVPMIFLHSAQPLPPGLAPIYRLFYRLIFPAVCAHISGYKQKSSWNIPYTISISRLKSQFSSLHSVFSSQPITNKKEQPCGCSFFIYWSFSICVFSKKRKQREVIIATTVASPMPLSCTGPTTMVAPERPEMRVTAERMRFLDLV